jgi:hypothetical protein
MCSVSPGWTEQAYCPTDNFNSSLTPEETMMPRKSSKPDAEKAVRDIPQATCRHYSAEEKSELS